MCYFIISLIINGSLVVLSKMSSLNMTFNTHISYTHCLCLAVYKAERPVHTVFSVLDTTKNTSWLLPYDLSLINYYYTGTVHFTSFNYWATEGLYIGKRASYLLGQLHLIASCNLARNSMPADSSNQPGRHCYSCDHATVKERQFFTPC